MSGTALIIGASGTIAKAIINALLKENINHKIILVSRNYQKEFSQYDCIEQYQSDYSDDNVTKICSMFLQQNVILDSIFICNGILHNSRIKPEKRLEDFTIDAFTQLITANALVPFNWLKNLLPIVRNRAAGKSSSGCKIVIFSARVGSIEDNHLGGWYSYRTSKAALNMLIKTAAIEFSRRSPSTSLIAFHPGTTDSKLSKPFQRNVEPGKLFDADWVANRLLEILSNLTTETKLQFIDYKMEPIPW